MSDPTDDDQLTAAALEELATVAERTARDQQRLARRARSMRRGLTGGRRWSELLEAERQPGLLTLLTGSVQTLQQLSGRFRQALGRALLDEGWSTRRIASAFGVSHQRVCAMLNRPDR